MRTSYAPPLHRVPPGYGHLHVSARMHDTQSLLCIPIALKVRRARHSPPHPVVHRAMHTLRCTEPCTTCGAQSHAHLMCTEPCTPCGAQSHAHLRCTEPCTPCGAQSHAHPAVHRAMHTLWCTEPCTPEVHRAMHTLRYTEPCTHPDCFHWCAAKARMLEGKAASNANLLEIQVSYGSCASWPSGCTSWRCM